MVEVRTKSRKRFGVEQIVQKLREAEVGLAKGRSVSEVNRWQGITYQTYYRWRKEYDSLKMDQARRLKKLGQQSARLKKVVVTLALDNAILRGAADLNF
jgi:hypothetical protein